MCCNVKPKTFDQQVPRTLASFFLFAVFCFIVIVAPPRYGSESGFGALIDKHVRLQNIRSPKIILVGGSNVALGVDSELLESLLQKPVVNMAFGCTVGLRYMLEEIKQELAPGDVVLIMPEYDYFFVTSNAESNARVNGSCELLNLIQVFPSSSQWVFATYTSAPERIFDLLYDCRRLVLKKWDFYKRLVQSHLDGSYAKSAVSLIGAENNIYDHRHAYNEHGDMVAHLSREAPGLNGMEVIGYSKYVFNPEASDVLAQFDSFARSRSARVIMSPPPLPERVYAKYKERIEDIYGHWKKIGQITVIACPEQLAYPEKYFFDTPYHLTKVGRELRTRLLAKFISKKAADL